MFSLRFDPERCKACETCDCLMKCQYISLSLEEARQEKGRLLGGEDCRILSDCVTCYACEEYCPNRKEALCCGGGDGNFFTDILGSGPESPSRNRVRDAAATGAEVLGVACPTCAKMFEDAVKAEDLHGKLRVMDLSEIVLEASWMENPGSS